MTTPSYHDLHITTADMPRRAVSALPFDLMVTCTRAGGWELWRVTGPQTQEVIAGEYGGPGLRLDVAGHVICDSLTLA